MTDDLPKRGRPRRWPDPRSRKLAHQQRQQEKLRLTNALLQAVRNAHVEEPELHRRIQEGDDAAVLQALIEHYQARYWGHWPCPEAQVTPARGGDPPGSP